MSNNAEELKLNMAAKIMECHDDVMNRVEALDTRINEVDNLTKCIPVLIQTVQAKFSESSGEL